MAYGKQQGRRIVGGKYIVSFFADNVIRVEDEHGCMVGMQSYTEVRNALELLPLLDEDGFRIEVVPCPDCNGEGKHSQHLGVINPEDWDDEDLDHYFAGHYDRTCRRCKGGGTLDVHVQCILEVEDRDSRCACEGCIAEVVRDEREARAVYRMESGLGWSW